MATNFYSSTHLFCTALQDSAGSRGASGSGLVGARQASSELTDRLAITRGDILAMQKRVEGGAEYSRIESRIETAGEGREGLSARGEGAGGKQEPSMISRGFVRPRSGRRLVSAGKSRPESARPLSGRGPIRPDTRGILKSQVLSRPPSLPFSLYLSLLPLSVSLCFSVSVSVCLYLSPSLTCGSLKSQASVRHIRLNKYVKSQQSKRNLLERDQSRSSLFIDDGDGLDEDDGRSLPENQIELMSTI